MTPLQPAQTYLDGLDREWDRVGAPGTWLTGADLQMVNRVLDAVVAPVNPMFSSVGDELEVIVPIHLASGMAR